MKIKVKNIDGKIIHIFVNNFDKCCVLKQKVEKGYGILSSRQKLLFNDELIDNDRILKNYGIKDGSEIELLVFNHKFPITINSSEGNPFELEVDSFATVFNLKYEIAKLNSIPIEKQQLLYNNKAMVDNISLFDSGIKGPCIINLIHRPVIKIYISENNEENIELEIEKHENINQLKNLFKDKSGRCLDDKIFIHNGILLEDDKLIHDYMIEDRSKIMLVPQLKTLNVTIYMNDGKCFLLQVDPNKSIYSLKCKIKELYGVPVIDQDLLHNNKLLNDDHSLLQSGIFVPSYINLVINGIEIFISNSINDENLSYQVNKKDTIKMIKQLIQITTNLHNDDQKLMFNEKILDDDKSLGEYGVVDGSRITLVS